MAEPILGEVTIVNDLGLHTRAATTLVKLANTFASEIQIGVSGVAANAKSIMGLLALGARKGTVLRLEVSGEDQTEAFAAVQRLIEQGFYEVAP
jgi:phosphocarrier protein HPr